MFLGGGTTGGKLEAVDRKMIPLVEFVSGPPQLPQEGSSEGKRTGDGVSTEARRRSRRAKESSSGASMPT
jgi:hypothetical protein